MCGSAGLKDEVEEGEAEEKDGPASSRSIQDSVDSFGLVGLGAEDRQVYV